MEWRLLTLRCHTLPLTCPLTLGAWPRTPALTRPGSLALSLSLSLASQDDFLLIHYDKGPCRDKLGHSRASVIWHRTQVGPSQLDLDLRKSVCVCGCVCVCKCVCEGSFQKTCQLRRKPELGRAVPALRWGPSGAHGERGA